MGIRILKRRKKIQRNPLPAGPRPRGLSWQPNVLTVERILKQSHAFDIADIFRRFGYQERVDQLPPLQQLPLSGDKPKVLRTPVQEMLSPGQRQTSVQKAANEFLASPDGQAAVEHAKAVLISEQVATDNTLVNRLCRDAAHRLVEEWHQSPRGKEVVRQLFSRIIEEKVNEFSPQVRRGWWQAQISQLSNGTTNAES